MRRLKYDREIYGGIIETGRLVSLAHGDLVKKLSDNEALECERFMVDEFEFESGDRFDETALDRICRVHAPLEANCWWTKLGDDVLRIKFYNIPARGD